MLRKKSTSGTLASTDHESRDRSVIEKSNQSVSRVPPEAQRLPQTVSPTSINWEALPPEGSLQPPLRSSPQSSASGTSVFSQFRMHPARQASPSQMVRLPSPAAFAANPPS